MVHNTVERRRERKVREILDQALELVVESGLDGLTVSALAKRMDWTKGALYRYYAGKGQLVAALNRRVLETWMVEVDAVIARTTGGPVAELHAVVETWIELAHARPAEFGLVSLTLADPRNLVESIEDASHVPVMMALLQRLATRVTAAQTAGELAPGDALARTLQLVFAVQGVLQLKKLARFELLPIDTRTLATHTATDLLTAWAKETP